MANGGRHREPGDRKPQHNALVRILQFGQHHADFMASIVLELRTDILRSKKSVVEILRTAKVISAELELNDISVWIEHELSGYGRSQVPEYRVAKGGRLEVYNPIHGWLFAGNIN